MVSGAALPVGSLRPRRVAHREDETPWLLGISSTAAAPYLFRLWCRAVVVMWFHVEVLCFVSVVFELPLAFTQSAIGTRLIHAFPHHEDAQFMLTCILRRPMFMSTRAFML